MSTSRGRPDELGDFLKARRAELTPRGVGLPDDGRRAGSPAFAVRRSRGLAAISVDYLTRLEQGPVRASESVLQTLSRALRLDDDQRAYAYELAGKVPAAPRRTAPQRVRPAMRRLLDRLTGTPALVLGRRLDILAWNSMASALYTDFSRIPADRRNYVRLLFTDPVVRALHEEWDDAALTVVASLRREAAHDPGDPALTSLVSDLSVEDAGFRRLWASHRVTGGGDGTKHLHHALVGALVLDCDLWDSLDGSGQRLVVLTADPGTPSYEALSILSSWTAAPPPRRTPRSPGG